MATVGQPLNFGSTPAAPSGSVNVTFQADAPTAPPTSVVRGVSAYVTFDYDAPFYFPALQTVANQEIFRQAFGRNVTFPGNFSGSEGSAKAAASATVTFIVNKNGIQVGTIVWPGTSPATFTPTFTTTGGAPVSFSPGDVLTIVGPAIADVTLANWGVTLVGTRTS